MILRGGALTYIFVYALAVTYGDQRPSNKFIFQKVLISPPVWALLVGLFVNFADFQTPQVIARFLNSLAGAYMPLVMLALGFYFNPKLVHPGLVGRGLATRMLGGLILGFIFSYFLNLNGIDRLVAIVCTSAPVGFNTLTFADMENLDKDFAASLVSAGILVGLISIPMLMVVLS